MSRLKLNTDISARQRQTFGKRLLRLEAYLSELPAKAYDHSTYIRTRNECGTVACALGHAVDSKLFRGLGIKVIGDGYDLDLDGKHGVMEDANAYFGPNTYSEVFASYSYRTSGHYVTVATVCAKLRKLARERYGIASLPHTAG